MMVVLRITSGIRRHFEDRFWEWVMGFTSVYWGLRLVGENDAWSNPQAWYLLLGIFEENTWGWIFITVGLLRLLALIINGTFANTWYSKTSPWVRAVGASGSAVLWFMAFMSTSATGTSGGGIYHLPLVVELWCMRRAWRDTGRPLK